VLQKISQIKYLVISASFSKKVTIKSRRVELYSGAIYRIRDEFGPATNLSRGEFEPAANWTRGELDPRRIDRGEFGRDEFGRDELT
jgi:hypothetical protein